jgi:hypothetical protein
MTGSLRHIRGAGARLRASGAGRPVAWACGLRGVWHGAAAAVAGRVLA